MPGSVPSPSPTAVGDAPPSSVPVSGPAHLLRVTLLMAGSCLPILGAVLIAPVLPKMQDHFASVPGAKALVPLALTVPALALALLAPFAGVIVDRLGRKRLLIVATLLYAVFGTAPLWLDSLGAIIASRALVGVTEAAIMTCCTTLIGDYYSGRRRVKYLALQTMCASASATVFFVLGGAAGSAGWRVPFWVYAVSLALAPLMATALTSPAPRTATEDTSTPITGQRAFPWRQLAGICALTFFGAMVFYTVPVEMSYLLDDLGVENSGVIGLATALASAATVGGAVTFARLKRSPDPILPAVLAVCAAGFGMMFLAGNPPLLVLGAVVNCVGTGMLLPALLTSAMSRLAFEDRGRGTGLWLAAFFGGEFVCPLVLLAGESAVGSLAGAVGVLGLFAALVAAGLWASRRRAATVDRRPLPEQLA
ncbi:Predicted arabinose efflux permease, MFS family [Streptomyces sp. 3213]|uniref:MFS transporter n=1 Tax=Streptomyces sp. 3213.3 TaxID=1855348 RepID=UPI00089ACECE|nr:MFS transporter [Streptomyces sp. 3213.3]SEF01546.1 Predicted arabinose efflux permease, MFS family [Streptomyces sp. 3213] [Streptomyces sp. 3213.3]